LTQNKAIELLKNKNDDYKNEVTEERNRLKESLSSLSFVIEVYPSDANFLLVKTINANEVYNQLLAQNIIIRNRTNEPLCKGCVRISIGTKEENTALIAGLKNIKI